MGPLNLVMNKVDSWSQKVDEMEVHQSWAKRHLLTRAVTVAAGVPLEITAVFQNIIATPVYAVGVVCKLATKTLRVCSSAEFLKKVDDALPSLADLARTVLRIIAYAVGTVFTATLGYLSPSANFRLHCSVPFLDLASNVRENKLKSEWQQKIEAEKQKRAEEEAQAEEILAAVAAMLEKAEYEAEREENALAEAAAKNAEGKPLTLEEEAIVAKQMEGEPAQAEDKTEAAYQPNFFQRLFGFSAPEKPAPVETPVEVPAAV